MSLKARLDALEQRRWRGDTHARARDALAHMGAPHLARDPVLAGRLRAARIAMTIDFHADASAVVADLASANIHLDPADAEALLAAARARAAALHARLHANPPAAPA